MQELLNRLIAELLATYFKPNGFKKVRHRFRREEDGVIQEVEFQSSVWNSSGAPVTFYVNISIGFTDIVMHDGKPALTGSGRIEGLVSAAPSQFGLTSANYERTRSDLLFLLPQALSEVPKHYEEVRSRAKAGRYTPIPLPNGW